MGCSEVQTPGKGRQEGGLRRERDSGIEPCDSFSQPSREFWRKDPHRQGWLGQEWP